MQNLNQQCRQLYEKLVQAEQIISNFNDVGMLLSIIKMAEYFDDDFIVKCTAKVQSVISEMLTEDNTEEVN